MWRSIIGKIYAHHVHSANEITVFIYTSSLPMGFLTDSQVGGSLYLCSTVNTIPIILSYRHRICEDPSQVARDNMYNSAPFSTWLYRDFVCTTTLLEYFGNTKFWNLDVDANLKRLNPSAYNLLTFLFTAFWGAWSEMEYPGDTIKKGILFQITNFFGFNAVLLNSALTSLIHTDVRKKNI